MLTALRRQRLQILLIFAIFLLFLAHAAGLFDVLLEVDGQLRLKRQPLAALFGASELPPVLRSLEFLVLLGLGVLLSLLLPLLSPIKASAATFLAMVVVFYLGYTRTNPRPLVPMEYSLLTLLVIYVVNVLASYFEETHKKQKLIDAFGQYLPPELVRTISRDPGRFSLEGESRELSVMFCDVHNFTAISEQLGPRQLSQLLNTLFTPLTAVLYRHRGTIDKYIGDAVMAFWGAPVEDPGHARHAVAAAFEIQRTVQALAPTFRDRGWPQLAVGIGINSGVMSVGNMGSEYRMAYTVVGDAVNLAARLQALTRLYGSAVLVGEATRDAAPGFLFRELDVVRVKGRSLPTRIYQPVAPLAECDADAIERVRRHEQALHRYYAGDWEAAAKAFRQLAEAQPGDPVYALYLKHIAERRQPPEAAGDGPAGARPRASESLPGEG